MVSLHVVLPSVPLERSSCNRNLCVIPQVGSTGTPGPPPAGPMGSQEHPGGWLGLLPGGMARSELGDMFTRERAIVRVPGALVPGTGAAGWPREGVVGPRMCPLQSGRCSHMAEPPAGEHGGPGSFLRQGAT